MSNLAANPIERLRSELCAHGLAQLVLSHPETLAHVIGFETPVEDWPVANPFLAGPPLLVVWPDDAVLLAPTFYGGAKASSSVRVIESRTHAFVGSPPDPIAEFKKAIDSLPLRPGPTGVEAGHLPLRVAQILRERALSLVEIDSVVVDARRGALHAHVEAVRRASHLADVAQVAVKEAASPGMTEAEVAGLAAARMTGEAGRRIPAILTVTAGAASDTGGGPAGSRVIGQGDLVLADVAPWIDGAWSDSANAIVVGDPSRQHRLMFDAVRRSLDLAIVRCTAGTAAADLDLMVRRSLADWGAPYPHHTGHGIGAAWCERPLILPGSGDVIEEGDVIALEPAIYKRGLGGIRLEHVIVVRASGNELLTKFEHRL